MARTSYYEKLQGVKPQTQDHHHQQQQRESSEVAAREYRLENMPEVVIRGSDAFCPFMACQRRQSSLKVGVHACTSGRCSREFRVPDTEVTQAISKRLRSASMRRQERDDYLGYSSSGSHFNDDY